jgi:cell division protein FtsZ
MFEIVETSSTDKANIKVIGVGGGGGNAVEHMIANTIEGVDFVCANTDAQALAKSSAPVHVQLGANLTKGLGAGADPELGRDAALEDRDRIAEILDGTDMLFITAGMGGGTGTGASPVIAQLAKEMNILTVAVVTKPFPFELKRRMNIAEQGIAELSEHVDSLITVPNEKLLSVLDKGISLRDTFRAANEVLHGAVRGIAELITRPGVINVDFADVRTVMSEKGRAMMGSGRAVGESRAEEAVHAAVNCPLLEDIDLSGACGILVNITAGPDMGRDEFAAVGEAIGDLATDDALMVIGTALDENIEDEMRVTVVATGLGDRRAEAEPEMRLVKPAEEAGNGARRDYRDYEQPTVFRAQNRAKPRGAAENSRETKEEFLNIPAFLQRQAD